MSTVRLLLIGLLPLLLGGCLEVEQHPAWQHGQYQGKPDNRSAQANFQGDQSSWQAAIANRNQLQNEYNRARP